VVERCKRVSQACSCEEVHFGEVLVQEFCSDFVYGPEDVGIPVPLILANVI